MEITVKIGSVDYELFKSIVNEGIDSHLEAFTKSEFHYQKNRLILNIHSTEIPLLVRRLQEIESEEAQMWAIDIQDADIKENA